MINRFMEASSIVHVREVTLAAIGISLMVILIQLIILPIVNGFVITSSMVEIKHNTFIHDGGFSGCIFRW